VEAAVGILSKAADVKGELKIRRAMVVATAATSRA
jgi:hypothetical protein